MIYEQFQAYRLEKRLRTLGGFEAGTKDELVTLAAAISKIPKASYPTPHKRRAYLTTASLPHVAHGLRMATLAGRLAGATLVLGILTTTVFAWASKPGSTLYVYKNRTQDLRLKLVASETEKADLRLSFAESRLAETQTLLESNADSNTKTAAISALVKQTEQTVAIVKQVALDQKDTGLLDRLQTITDKQTEVISSASDPAVQSVAQSALKTTAEGTKQIAETKRLVIAGSEAALAKLNATTTSTGTVTKVTVDKVYIAKEVFTLNTETKVVVDAQLEALKPVVQVGQQVSISATQTSTGELVATEIRITAIGKVKGTTTTTPEPTPTIEETIPEDANPENAPPAAQAGFLVEDPAPLYNE